MRKCCVSFFKTDDLPPSRSMSVGWLNYCIPMLTSILWIVKFGLKLVLPENLRLFSIHNAHFNFNWNRKTWLYFTRAWLVSAIFTGHSTVYDKLILSTASKNLFVLISVTLIDHLWHESGHSWDNTASSMQVKKYELFQSGFVSIWSKKKKKKCKCQ